MSKNRLSGIRLTLVILLTLGFAIHANVYAQDKNITVGGKFFTEQYILAEITKQALEKKGFTVTTKVGLGSNLVRKAQELGEVDLYWEYTGTSLVAYNKVKKHFNKEQTYQEVKKLDAKKGIIWLDPADANNTFCIMMNRDEASNMGISSISDFVNKIGNKKLTFAVTAEFLGRPDGLKGLEKAYKKRLSRKSIKSMDSGLIYTALKNNQVNAGIGFATDGRIAAYNFVLLKDNKSYFPDYTLAAVVRKEMLNKYPEIRSLMNAIAARLNDRILQDLNAQVDIQKKTVNSVAQGFIKKINFKII